MFIGHYGVSFALRRKKPALSLSLLFILVQFLDILFFLFVLVGVEKLRLVPGFTEYNPYDLFFMPYSHGLISALGWSILLGFCYLFFSKKNSSRKTKWIIGLVIAFAVFSHWLLDFPMHTHDLPILGNSSPKLGLGLWNHKWLSLITEFGVLSLGWTYYFRGSEGFGVHVLRKWIFIIFLLVILVITPFMPSPTSSHLISYQALAMYFLLPVFARWSEK